MNLGHMLHTPRGILLPEELLYSDWFNVLASFVAINTVIYLVLGVSKILPVVRVNKRSGRNRRSETRNIDPEAPM